MMAYYYSSSFQSLLPAISLLLFSAVSVQGGNWESATATSSFNGQDLAGCGFENQTEYGGKTVAVSTALYSNGRMCGACFEIKCSGGSSRNCLPKTVQVTAAAACSPSYFNGTRNWCAKPGKHFELPTSIFSSISNDGWAVVPVEYRRVKCAREGGIRFRVAGSRGIVGVMVYNVAGSGDVVGLKIKGSEESEWVEMINGDDQRWVTSHRVLLAGQRLSFRVTSSDGKVVESKDVVPKNWKFGETYEGGQFK